MMQISMSENKMAIWYIAGPTRPYSIFNSLAIELLKNGEQLCALGEPTLAGLPPLFMKVFDFENASIVETCPYRKMANLLAALLHLECTRNTIVKCLSFASHMDTAYKQLLRARDAKALLILAYWHSKVMNSVWWLDRRATMDCQAICLYLERNYTEEKDILELLKYPKDKCGVQALGNTGISRHIVM